MIKFKVLKGHFFSGSVNGSAPNEVEVPDEEALSNEQLRDIIEGYLNSTLEFEDTQVVSDLAKKYLERKGITDEGVLAKQIGLLDLEAPGSR